MKRVSLVVIACLAVNSMSRSNVHAQTQAPGDGSRGPMTIERVDNGFAIMPEAKITEIDGRTGTLTGASGGWMIDNTLLIGAGGYWLANGNRGRRLGYGGAVVEWLRGTDQRFGFALRGLVGAGRATLNEDVSILRAGVDRRLTTPATVQVRLTRDVFVAEPQADLLVNF